MTQLEELKDELQAIEDAKVATVLQRLMVALEKNQQHLTGEEAASYTGMFSATYGALVNHEKVKVRTDAVQHLKELQSKGGK